MSFWPFIYAFQFSRIKDYGATVFGPRYLISAIPFLAFYSGYYLKGARVNTTLIYSFLVVFGSLVCIANVLDGLASGKLFSQTNCQTLKFGSYIKSIEYYKNIKTRTPGPMLLKL